MPHEPVGSADSPKLRAGALVTEEQLADLARQAVERDGRPRQDIADELGQKAPALSRALNRPEASATGLRRTVIDRLTEYRIEGPFYRVVKK